MGAPAGRCWRASPAHSAARAPWAGGGRLQARPWAAWWQGRLLEDRASDWQRSKAGQEVAAAPTLLGAPGVMFTWRMAVQTSNNGPQNETVQREYAKQVRGKGA